MCKKYAILIGSLTFFPMLPARLVAADAKAEEAKAQVRKLQEGFVDAFGKGSKALGAYLESVLSDDAIITDNRGRVYDKKKFLEMAKSGDRGPLPMEQPETKIQVYGETAVMTGLVVAKGLPQEAYRMTTVFVRSQNQWRIVAMQLTTVSRP